MRTLLLATALVPSMLSIASAKPALLHRDDSRHVSTATYQSDVAGRVHVSRNDRGKISISNRRYLIVNYPAVAGAKGPQLVRTTTTFGGDTRDQIMLPSGRVHTVVNGPANTQKLLESVAGLK